jgi:hypothetical protein
MAVFERRVGVLVKRHLAAGQVYTSHDGSNLYRRIIETAPAEVPKPARWVVYRTNRGGENHLHHCLRSTFVDWIRARKARKTQKYRRRQL